MTVAQGQAFVQAVRSSFDKQVGNENCEMMLFVPYTLLGRLQDDAGSIVVGAQNVHEADHGAFTGEISLSMLHDLGIHTLLIGHSERRHVFGESLDRIAAKVRVGLTAGDTVVLCVGETLAQREADQVTEVLEEQLLTALAQASPDQGRLIVAYEPVWAIGTGKTATPEMADAAHRIVRNALDKHKPGLGDQTSILYGGSVKPDNAAQLMSCPNIDGVLVGGASLKPETWIPILAAVAAAQG